MNVYEVALGNKVEALIAEVERLTGLGYICQGGIAISESYGRMAQAMVLQSVAPIGPEPELATVTLYPTSKTIPAVGGSGSINVTLTTPGTWEVDAATVPAWLTLEPMGPQTEDVQIVYTATPNTGAARQAVLEVNDATLTLDQDAGAVRSKTK